MQYFVIQCKDKFWSLKGWADIHHATKYQSRNGAEKAAKKIVRTNRHRCFPGRVHPVVVEEVVVTYSFAGQQTYIGGQSQNAI